MSEELTTRNGAIAVQTEERYGFDAVDISEITLPTAKLLQPTSPELTDDTYSDFNLKAGKLIHSLLMEELSQTFAPIMFFNNNMCFVPKNAENIPAFKDRIKARFGVELTEDDLKNMFVCRSSDGKTGDRFGSCADCKLDCFDGANKPVCSRNINVLAMFDGQDLPVVLRFTSTSAKHGRKFKDIAFYAGGSLFSRKYKTAIAKKQEDGKTWFELMVKPAGKATEEEAAKFFEIYKNFRNAVIQVDDPFDTSEEPKPVSTEY